MKFDYRHSIYDNIYFSRYILTETPLLKNIKEVLEVSIKKNSVTTYDKQIYLITSKLLQNITIPVFLVSEPSNNGREVFRIYVVITYELLCLLVLHFSSGPVENHLRRTMDWKYSLDCHIFPYSIMCDNAYCSLKFPYCLDWFAHFRER